MDTVKSNVLGRLMTRDVVRLGVEGPQTPQEVIAYSGRLLKEAGKVKEKYVEDMVAAYDALGAYIVIAPGLAMPHARPGGNVYENAVSFVQLRTPISFAHSCNDPVRIVIALAGVSNDEHIDLLKDLSSLLGTENVIEKLANVSSYEELINIIEKEG